MALRTYAGQAGRLWATAALMSAPSALIAIWVGGAYPTVAVPPPSGYLAAVAGVGLLTAALNVIALGAITVMGDAPGTPIGDALARGLACFWRLLGVGLLTAVVVAVGLICLVVPGIYLAVALSLVTPAVVLGRSGVRAAMGASYRLTTHGTFWRAAGTLLVAAIITTLVGWALGIAPALSSAMQAFSGQAGVGPPSSWQKVLSWAGQIVTMPFGTLVAVVLYRDLQSRKGMG